MVVNIVDTKGTFKKKIENDLKPNSISEYLTELKNIETSLGKRLIANLDGLRWRIEDLEYFFNKGCLKKELTLLVNENNSINVEISDI